MYCIGKFTNTCELAVQWNKNVFFFCKVRIYTTGCAMTEWNVGPHRTVRSLTDVKMAEFLNKNWHLAYECAP